MDRFAHHDAGGLQLQGAAALDSLDLAKPVERPSERIHGAAEVPLADGNREHLSGAPHFLALFDRGELAEDDDADLALLQVHGQAEGSVFEGQQFVGHGAGKPLDAGDAVGGQGDVADLLAHGLGGLVGAHKVVERRPDLLGLDGKFSHSSFLNYVGGGRRLLDDGVLDALDPRGERRVDDVVAYVYANAAHGCGVDRDVNGHVFAVTR